ncbi:MAG: hypothetical protein ACRD0H_13790 [Actinomycetes bacterium]
MGFFYWGEKDGPEGAYHRARRNVEIDPRKVTWPRHRLNEKAVARYERNPGAYSDDGDPLIVRRRDGSLWGQNGKHRGEAARRQGRRLRARYYDERWDDQ